MKKQLTYVSPRQAGIVMGVLYGLLSLVFVPIFLISTLFGAAWGGKSDGTSAILSGIFFIIVFPVMYTVGGFVIGIIGAALYNVVAKWTGGLEFQVKDVPAATQTSA